MSKLQDYYRTTIVKQLMERFGYDSVMEVPRIIKVSLNMGVGEAINDKKILDAAMSEMTAIAGQKCVKTLAKKSIAGFKIREGWPIGCKVTLRRDRMYEFLQRLIEVTLPRVRDFRGVSPRSFDGHGNFSMGIKEQLVFPEINFDKVDAVRGLDITIATTAKTDEEARALLAAFSFPFRDMERPVNG